MAKTGTRQLSWAHGQLSRKMTGRADMQQVYSAAQEVVNFICHPQGPASFRNGSYFVHNSKGNNKPRLMPFRYSDDASYMIEFTNTNCRFYVNNGILVESAQTITGITKANPAVVTTSGSHGYSNGDDVIISDVVGMTEVNGGTYTVANVTATTFELSGIDSSAYTTYSSGGESNKIFDLTTSYLTADLFALQHAQNANQLYIAHNDYYPQVLTRTSSTVFTIANADFDEPPFMDENVSTTTLTPSAITGSVTITASASTFASTDVGRHVRINSDVLATAETITNITQANPAVVTTSGAHNYVSGDKVYIESVTGMTEVNDMTFTIANAKGTTFELLGIDSSSYTAYSSGGTSKRVESTEYGYAVITAYTSTTQVTATTIRDFFSTDAKTTWQLGSFSETTGYPAAVTFYENRLFYGGTISQPQRVFGSVSGVFNDFSVGTDDDDGLQFELVSNTSNPIRYLIGMPNQLVVGTASTNFVITGNDNNSAITPTSVKSRPADRVGVAAQSPIFKEQLLFVEDNLRKVRALNFDLVTESYKSIDLNLLSDEITDSGITQMCHQAANPNLVWAAKSNGDYLSLSYQPGQEIIGWMEHNTRSVDDICTLESIPRSDNYEQLWLGAKRIINGSTTYAIEYMTDPIEFSKRNDINTGIRGTDDLTFAYKILEEQKQYIHLDSALTYDGTIYGSEASATLTPGNTTGTGITFTASASVFTSDMEGRELWRKSVTGLEFGRAKITQYNSATSVTCDIKLDFDSTDAIPAGEWYITTNTVSNLRHLEGETVGVVTDGAVHPDKTVSSNSITLDYEASVVHVGLRYSGRIRGIDMQAFQMPGPYKTIMGASVKFYDTLSCKFGSSIYNLKTLLFRNTNSLMNNPPIIFTGVKDFVFPADTMNTEKSVYIVQDNPVPCNVQQIWPTVDVND